MIILYVSFISFLSIEMLENSGIENNSELLIGVGVFLHLYGFIYIFLIE